MKALPLTRLAQEPCEVFEKGTMRSNRNIRIAIISIGAKDNLRATWELELELLGTGS